MNESEDRLACGLAWCEQAKADGRKRPLQIRRLSGLQGGNPFDIQFMGFFTTFRPRQDEARLHAEFAPYRVRGEWFKLPEHLYEKLLRKASYRLD